MLRLIKKEEKRDDWIQMYLISNHIFAKVQGFRKILPDRKVEKSSEVRFFFKSATIRRKG